MADMGLRPGEVRALDVAHFDFSDSWLAVSKAVKGARLDSPIRETKTGAVRRVRASDRLIRWISQHMDPRGRLTQTPLFINPATGTRYTHSAFRRTWKRACEHADVSKISIYQGTKHGFATDAVRRGVPEGVVQRMLGHRDVTSTQRYPKLADEALVYALRDRRVANERARIFPPLVPQENPARKMSTKTTC